MNDLNQKISVLISENRIDESFQYLFQLADFFKNTEKINQLVILKSRYYSNKNNDRQGTIDEVASRIEMNKIITGLLNVKEDLFNSGNKSIFSCADPCSDTSKDIERNFNSSVPLIFDKIARDKEMYTDTSLMQKQIVYEIYLQKSRELQEQMLDAVNFDYLPILVKKLISKDKIEMAIAKDLMIMPFSNKISSDDKLIIISAITVRLSYELDSLLIEVLINFLMTFNEKIWEKSLVGLILVLRLNFNKIQLYPDLILKLEKIKEISSIQEAISKIDSDLRRGKGKKLSDLSVKGVKNEKLKSNFFDRIDNWFKPFNLGCEFVKDQIKSLPNFKDVQNFPELLNSNRHLATQVKYMLFLSAKDLNPQDFSKLIDFLENDKCDYDHKFDNILTDYFYFFNNYPTIKDDKQGIINSEESIYELSISDVISNSYYKNMYFAEKFFTLKEYTESIEYFKLAINANPTGRSCNFCKLFYSFIEVNDRKSAAEYSKISYENFKNSRDLFYSAKNYFLSNQYDLGMSHLLNFESQVETLDDKILLGKLYIYANMLKETELIVTNLSEEENAQNGKIIAFLAYKSFYSGNFKETEQYIEKLPDLEIETKAIKFFIDVLKQPVEKIALKKLKKYLKESKDQDYLSWNRLELKDIIDIARMNSVFKEFIKTIEVIDTELSMIK